MPANQCRFIGAVPFAARGRFCRCFIPRMLRLTRSRSGPRTKPRSLARAIRRHGPFLQKQTGNVASSRERFDNAELCH